MKNCIDRCYKSKIWNNYLVFFFNFKTERASCSAAVPLLVAKEYFDFVNLENFFSNKFTYFPTDEIHPD